MSRVFLTVLDAVGAGEAPDAAEYGDAGANTLGHVISACHPDLPNMAVDLLIHMHGLPDLHRRPIRRYR